MTGGILPQDGIWRPCRAAWAVVRRIHIADSSSLVELVRGMHTGATSPAPAVHSRCSAGVRGKLQGLRSQGETEFLLAILHQSAVECRL